MGRQAVLLQARLHRQEEHRDGLRGDLSLHGLTFSANQSTSRAEIAANQMTSSLFLSENSANQIVPTHFLPEISTNKKMPTHFSNGNFSQSGNAYPLLKQKCHAIRECLPTFQTEMSCNQKMSISPFWCEISANHRTPSYFSN